jgi:surface protein
MNDSNRNEIKSLDLSNNNEITYLSLDLIGLEGALNTSNLENLIGLSAGFNPDFTSLDLSNNTNLSWLNIGFNSGLNSIDLSNLTELEYLSLRAMSINFTDIDVSNNNKLVVFDTTYWYDTSESKCIKVSQYQIDNQITNNSINGKTTDFTVYYNEGMGQIFSSVDWTKDENNSYQLSCNPDDTSTTSDKIYFENNTCKCPEATLGDTSVINGVTYTAVDNSTISGEIANGNVNLCTTLVTSMQNLFSGKANFNSDIGFWDTSNVTNMDRMFENASSFNQDISGWCVSNINSEPINFLFSSALTDANKPVWGTCPSD